MNANKKKEMNNVVKKMRGASSMGRETGEWLQAVSFFGHLPMPMLPALLCGLVIGVVVAA